MFSGGTPSRVGANMKRPRRTISKIVIAAALYLLAGAITTIAVAWSTLWLVGFEIPYLAKPDVVQRSYARFEGFDQSGTIVFMAWNRSGVSIALVSREQAGGLQQASYHSKPVLPLFPVECRGFFHDWILSNQSPERYRTVDLRGWPMHALWCAPAENDYLGKWEARAGIALESMPPTTSWIPRFATLPLAPLWGGFAIDTLFYAAIWFMTIAGFVQTRRFVRSRRGRCTRCGYQLNDGFAGCSECGFGRET